MGLRYLFLGLVLCLLPLRAGARGAADAPGSRVPKAVSTDPSVRLALDVLSAPTTDRLEILALPQDVLTRFDIRPDLLEGQYEYKITARLFHGSEYWHEFVYELRHSTIKRTEAAPSDVRWGCIFYDKSGATVLTMYFDGFGMKGVINGTPVTGVGPIVKMLERRCSSVWAPPRHMVEDPV
jgi:hypothetical protein